MTIMALLARYGGVQPSEYNQMDWHEAEELALRLLEIVKGENEGYADLHMELTKGIMRASGAKLT